VPPEENLEDILENQEPLRWGDKYDFFSSELVRASAGRVGAVWPGVVFGGAPDWVVVGGGEPDAGGPAGMGESRAGCVIDLRLVTTFVPLSGVEDSC